MRQKGEEKQPRNENDLIAECVAKHCGERDPGTGSEESRLRRQIVAVAAQPTEGLGVRPGVSGFRKRNELFFDFFKGAALDPRCKPLMDVATAGNCRKII